MPRSIAVRSSFTASAWLMAPCAAEDMVPACDLMVASFCWMPSSVWRVWLRPWLTVSSCWGRVEESAWYSCCVPPATCFAPESSLSNVPLWLRRVSRRAPAPWLSCRAPAASFALPLLRLALPDASVPAPAASLPVPAFASLVPAASWSAPAASVPAPVAACPAPLERSPSASRSLAPPASSWSTPFCSLAVAFESSDVSILLVSRFRSSGMAAICQPPYVKSCASPVMCQSPLCPGMSTYVRTVLLPLVAMVALLALSSLKFWLGNVPCACSRKLLAKSAVAEPSSRPSTLSSMSSLPSLPASSLGFTTLPSSRYVICTVQGSLVSLLRFPW